MIEFLRRQAFYAAVLRGRTTKSRTIVSRFVTFVRMVRDSIVRAFGAEPEGVGNGTRVELEHEGDDGVQVVMPNLAADQAAALCLNSPNFSESCLCWMPHSAALAGHTLFTPMVEVDLPADLAAALDLNS